MSIQFKLLLFYVLIFTLLNMLHYRRTLYAHLVLEYCPNQCSFSLVRLALRLYKDIRHKECRIAISHGLPAVFCGTPQQSWQPSQSPPGGDKPQHNQSTKPSGLVGAVAAGTGSPDEDKGHCITHILCLITLATLSYPILSQIRCG